MKNFIKNDWFKIIIVFILIVSLIIIYNIYYKKQKEFKICVKIAQEKKIKTEKEVTMAWTESKVTGEWKEQAYGDVKGIYNDEIKDCLLIK